MTTVYNDYEQHSTQEKQKQLLPCQSHRTVCRQVRNAQHRKTIQEKEEMKQTKSLYEYKIGEVCKKDLMMGVMKAPNKLVKISYTFQDKNGNKMDAILRHKDYIEEEQ